VSWLACVQDQRGRYGTQLWVSLLDNVGKEAGLQQQLLYLVQAYNGERTGCPAQLRQTPRPTDKNARADRFGQPSR
jgi:hypothetical protein